MTLLSVYIKSYDHPKLMCVYFVEMDCKKLE